VACHLDAGGPACPRRLLKIIPTDQNHVPTPEQQEKALTLLRKMVPFGMHEARVFDDLTFIDQGEYCEAVLCPSCSSRVGVDPFSGSDLAQDWYHALDEAIIAGAPVRTLKTTMPCCGASVPFTSLRFHLPAGFACFELSVTDPYTEDNRTVLGAEQLGELESVLGCKLTQIEARY
jgi:hypothetical protein